MDLMNAVVLPAYNQNILRAMLSLKIKEVETLKPGEDEVLVKMHASVVNPSDIAFLRGGYNIVKSLPAIPGFEGSGTIVETGNNVENLVGLNVSCFVQSDKSGTWAEYFVANKNDIIVLSEEMELDPAAAFSVNPFTAYGLVKIAKCKKSKAIIQNASGGQVAQFIRKLANLEGIQVINIVRKESTLGKLSEQGEQYVLCEQDDTFVGNLTSLALDLNATTAFDAVGGTLAGLMFNAMPKNSEMVVYGGLSGKKISDINEMDIIFGNKRITGFNLNDWKNQMPLAEFESISQELQKKFISGDLKNNYQGSVNMPDIVDGLKAYLGNMSDGKILIKP